MTHKTCLDCKTEKPVSDFNRRYDGYQTYCRVCHNRRVKVRDTRMRELLPAGQIVECHTCRQEKPRVLAGRNFCADCIRAYQQTPEQKRRSCERIRARRLRLKVQAKENVQIPDNKDQQDAEITGESCSGPTSS